MTPAKKNLDAAMLTAAEAARITAQKIDQSQDIGRGIAYMIVAAGLFTIMDALVKWLSPSYPTMQIVFFRSVFAFVPLSIFIMRELSWIK